MDGSQMRRLSGLCGVSWKIKEMSVFSPDDTSLGYFYDRCSKSWNIWERPIWSSWYTLFLVNPHLFPCSCPPSWQLGRRVTANEFAQTHRMMWHWETRQSPLSWFLMKSITISHLLKLCFSPDAEWTMTFRKPYKPDDSSSAESRI